MLLHQYDDIMEDQQHVDFDDVLSWIEVQLDLLLEEEDG